MCQRLVCQKRVFTVRSSSCEVYPKLKNSIFRINMKHSYFSNYLFPINFSVVETVDCQKLIHVYAYVLVV